MKIPTAYSLQPTAYSLQLIYLISQFQALTGMVTRWVEPGDSTTNGLAMLLPHSNHTEDGKITRNLDLWLYTAMTGSIKPKTTKSEFRRKK